MDEWETGSEDDDCNSDFASRDSEVAGSEVGVSWAGPVEWVGLVAGSVEWEGLVGCN